MIKNQLFIVTHLSTSPLWENGYPSTTVIFEAFIIFVVAPCLNRLPGLVFNRLTKPVMFSSHHLHRLEQAVAFDVLA